MSKDEADASLYRLQQVYVEQLPPSRFDPLRAEKPQTPTVTGFEAPSGYTSTTVEWGGERITVAVPEGWSVYEHPMVSVIDLSPNARAQQARFSGDEEGDGEVQPVRIRADDDVAVTIASAGLTNPVRDLATTDLSALKRAAPPKQKVKNPTVVVGPTTTTLGGHEARLTTVRGTGAGGRDVTYRSILLRAGDTALDIAVHRPTGSEAVSDETLQTILESIAVEDADVARNQQRQPADEQADRPAPDVVERYPIKKDGAWGYIDASGKVAIAPRFEEAEPFADGYAKVTTEDGPAYIDASGSVVLEPDVAWARSFSNGLAVASPPNSNKVGFIDTTGSFVIEPRFEDARAFANGRAPIAVSGARFPEWGFVNRSGEVVIEPQYADVRAFAEGRAPVAVEGEWSEKWGFVDRAGEMVIEPQYGEARPFSEDRAAVQKSQEGMGMEGLWGYINPSGEMVIDAEYDDARSFSAGLAPVKGGFDEKWGYIDRSGEEVIDLEYTDATPFHGTLARITTSGASRAATAEDGEGWAYINRNGRTIWP
jgi:hypothetical protein